MRLALPLLPRHIGPCKPDRKELYSAREITSYGLFIITICYYKNKLSLQNFLDAEIRLLPELLIFFFTKFGELCHSTFDRVTEQQPIKEGVKPDE